VTRDVNGTSSLALRTRPRVASAWVLALTLGVCACVGSPSAPVGSTTATTATADTAPTTGVLSPTVEFFAGGRTAATNSNMIEESVSACMEDRGWEYQPVLQESDEPLTVQEMEAAVQQYGYAHYSSPPLSDSRRAAPDANHAYWQSLTAEQQRQYSIDLGNENADNESGLPPEGRSAPPGSCRAIAEDEIDLPLYNEELMDRMRELFVDSRNSAEVVAARLAWSACMRLRGYDVALPDDADELALSEGAGLPVEDAIENEIAIASADFDCRRSTILPLDQAIEREIVDILRREFPASRG